jgi:hypothetical protein
LRVFSGAPSGSLISEGYAFPPVSGQQGQFSNSIVWSSGLRVAATDVNGDGKADIIVAPGRGQPPLVRIVDGNTMADLLGTTLVANNPGFLGGIFVGGI